MRAVSPHNEKLVPAKKGFTLMVGETLIHSRYDPESEAEKYIDSILLKAFTFYILIEPGLGYLACAIKKRFPESCIITLHCSPFFDKPEPASWNPASSETLEDFLEDLLEGTDASDIKLVDWKPAIQVYGKAALDLAARTVKCIKQISAGRKTVQNFGRRWIRNTVRNLELFNREAEIARGSVPVLVCAAGPGLEDSLDYIAAWKQSPFPPFLIAVSSSVPALLYRGIKPDVIVSTDGGSWALFHLIESFRRYNSIASSRTTQPIVAAALTSAFPSALAAWPVVFIRDGSLWQEILSREAGALQGTKLVFPQRGTVSVTAIDLAFFLSRGNVYVSGLDFSHRDLLTHSRPYAFERFQEENAFRIRPRYSQIFEREAMIRASGSHGIYASWVAAHLSSYPQRLFTLTSSPNDFPQKVPGTNETGETIGVTVTQRKAIIGGAEKPLRKHLIDVLLYAIDNPFISQQLCKELGALLVGKKPAKEKELPGLIRNAILELV